MQSTVTPLRKEFASKMDGLILDCGSGDNAYWPYFKGKVVALDLDERAVERSSGLKIIGDMTTLPFKNSCFGSVWACAIIEHTEKDTIPELKRVAKKNGQIAILTPNRYSLLHLLLRAWGHPGWWGFEGHKRLYSYSQLRKYGKVWGELWRIPLLDKMFRKIPMFAHTIMLLIYEN